MKAGNVPSIYAIFPLTNLGLVSGHRRNGSAIYAEIVYGGVILSFD